MTLAISLMPAHFFGSPAARSTVAGAMWMVTWWVTEAVPLWATSILPIVLFPLLGILSLKPALMEYVRTENGLFLGGMLIAQAMQKVQLHRRIALSIIVAVGRTPATLLGGVLLATAFISMWISNTATAVMMLPIGMAIISQLEEKHGITSTRTLATSLVLAICYGANVGGLGTLIGTAPNVVLARHAKLGFVDFFKIGFPCMITLLPVVWGVLWWRARDARGLDIGRAKLRDELQRLGAMSQAERLVSTVFVTAILLWSALPPILQGLGMKEPTEWISALVCGGVLLVFPCDGWKPVLDLRTALRLPWGILALLGGGFILATAIDRNGVSTWMAQRASFIQGLSPLAMIFVVALLVTLMTEVMSNTACANITLPILGSLLSSPGKSAPLSILAAAALCSSLGFMMPAGTPPNAIVFASGRITVGQMVRTGFVLDLLGTIVVAVILTVNPCV